MLKRVVDKEIMTIWDAMKKYESQYFAMIITKTVDRGQNDLGYVIYTADDREELNKINRDEYSDKMLGYLNGYNAEPFPMVGGVICHE